MLATSLATMQAGSASWRANPLSSDWNTAANWRPATVPDGSEDRAVFDISNTTSVSVSATVTIAHLIFKPGASAFTIDIPSPTFFEIGGAGITNDSTTTQNFTTNRGYIMFFHAATAGESTSFTNSGGDSSSVGGVTQFAGNSNAGSATFTNQAPLQPGFGGFTDFFNSSSAANGTFINAGGENGAHGGETDFFDSSNAGSGTFISEAGTAAGSFGGGETRFFTTASAADGTFISNGGMSTSAFGGLTDFTESSTASNATLIANGGANGGLPGSIVFEGSSDGGIARVEVYGDGNLSISTHAAPGVTIGSLAGDGFVFLGPNNLAVGAGSLNTHFEGMIQGTVGGSLTKIGSGTLTLTRGNSYFGGTSVAGGTLVASNGTGSATGSGPVEVSGGTLVGDGSIAGEVTVGGSGHTAVISAGRSLNDPGVLTIRGLVTLQGGATYKCGLKSDLSISAEVIASGVTISGADFSLQDFGSSALPPGTVFTVLDNTAASAISGTFANLPDGSTLTVANNSFSVNYEGGDGNDLTLTVLP